MKDPSLEVLIIIRTSPRLAGGDTPNGAPSAKGPSRLSTSPLCADANLKQLVEARDKDGAACVSRAPSGLPKSCAPSRRRGMASPTAQDGQLMYASHPPCADDTKSLSELDAVV